MDFCAVVGQRCCYTQAPGENHASVIVANQISPIGLPVLANHSLQDDDQDTEHASREYFQTEAERRANKEQEREKEIKAKEIVCAVSEEVEKETQSRAEETETLEIVFRCGASSHGSKVQVIEPAKVVHFTERPLGLTFEPVMPLTLGSVTDQAAKLGCKVGWEIHTVGGEDVTEKTYEEAVVAVQRAAISLPMVGSVLEIEFAGLGGSTRTVHFTQRPLEFEFDKAMPLTVSAVVNNGHAEHKGVENGWVIRSVAGHDVSKPNMTFEQALAILQKEVAVLRSEDL